MNSNLFPGQTIILTVACGNPKYAKQAMALAMSIRLHGSRAPLVLVTEVKDAEVSAWFDACVALEEDHRYGFLYGTGGNEGSADITNNFWALIEDGEPRFRKTSFDVERAIAALEASEWPGAHEFVAENLRAAVPREEAIAHFEGKRE